MTDLHIRFEPTLDAVCEMKAHGEGKLEVWTFDDRNRRDRAQKLLRSKGIEARIHSTYKPLLCFFLETVDVQHLRYAEIIYPCHPAADHRRFLLEAYPLHQLYPQAQISFKPASSVLQYDVTLGFQDGRIEHHVVRAPNRLHTNVLGHQVLSPTGWIAWNGEEGERLETDYEKILAALLNYLNATAWRQEPPFFERLNASVTLPIADEVLAVGTERLSVREALAEDIYFSVHEFFYSRAKLESSARTLKLGQVVPIVTTSASGFSLTVNQSSLSATHTTIPSVAVDRAGGPIGYDQIRRELSSVGGQPITAVTASGRIVEGRHISGTDRGVIITGGQHANETSGVVGAIRAAHALARRPGANFSVIPVENLDGYELHLELTQLAPDDQHHAARFTALGDDLGARVNEEGEAQARAEGRLLANAILHVNLHGYPSHEWVRPLSGYIPQNYEKWTLPKGFFLIANHAEGYKEATLEILKAVANDLNDLKELSELNSAQIQLFERYAGDTGFEIIDGLAFYIAQKQNPHTAIEIITEYPDQIIWGGNYEKSHETQMTVILSAYRALQKIYSPINKNS